MQQIRIDQISRAELERRWRLAREMMAREGLDALIVQSSNSFHGGYLRWFTDTPAMNGGFSSVLFPRDDEMVAFRHGASGHAAASAADPGISSIYTEPTFAAVDYTKSLYSSHLLAEVRRRGYRRVGIVGPIGMSGAFLRDIENALGADIADVTEQVDRLKAVKSAEEFSFIRAAAEMQDAVFQEVLKYARPGVKLYELAALAQYEGQKRGSTQGLFLVGGGPVGTAAPVMPRYMQGHTLEAGDYFSILIESNGPGGFYTELGRTCVFGKASSRLEEELVFVLEAQRLTLELLVPGAEPAEVLPRYNDFMVANGRPPERRLHCHSQGYDLVERPLVTSAESIPIEIGMNVACHPTYVLPDVFAWICDNYVSGNDGWEPLHLTPQRIFEI